MNLFVSNLISFLTALACVLETFLSLTCKTISPGIGRMDDKPTGDLISSILHGNPDEN